MNDTKFRILPIGHQRLLSLANHLEQPTLAKARFDLHIKAYRGNVRLATQGFAVGEFPVLWPQQWCWRDFKELNYTVLTNNSVAITQDHGLRLWFEISSSSLRRLFYPVQHKKHSKSQGETLNQWATGSEVAANIREFVNSKIQIAA